MTESTGPGSGHHDSTEIRIDTPKVLDELSRSNSAKSPLQDRRKRGLRRFLIILVLLIPVVLTVSWLVYQQLQISAEMALLRDENAALQSSLNDIPGDLPAPTPTVDPRELQQLRTELESRLNALTSTTAALQQRLAEEPQERDSNDLLWSEAEYLLRLANQKLHLEGDTESTLLLLTTVDSLLSEATAPALFTVREAIAGEILAVRSVEPIDVSGLYARLNNLVPMVEQLSLRNTLVQNYNARLAQQQDSVNPELGFVARSIELLRSVFVWQRWDVAPEALLPPQQEAVLKQNLRLMLEQTKLALLAEEETAYRDSLTQGRDWISRYFAIDSGVGRTLLEELDELSSITIVQKLPDISGSLEALLQVSENRLPPVRNDGNRP